MKFKPLYKIWLGLWRDKITGKTPISTAPAHELMRGMWSDFRKFNFFTAREL